MKRILLIILAILAVVAAILVINTFNLSSKQMIVDHKEMITPRDSAINHLSEAIRYQTISLSEDAPPDSAAFAGLHAFLRRAYPSVYSTMNLTMISEYSLLFKWEGTDASAKPLIFMSHQDVVPVDKPTLEKWEGAPFKGEIKNGIIYGRGTMDDKSSLIALLESAEMLISEGFKPKQTIYFAFGHDEEVGGENGAAKIAEYLKKEGVQASFTLDEGGFIATDMIPGVEKSVAMINVAEKGFASFRIIVETLGGHSSQPPKDNTIGMLAKAIVKLEENQLPYKLVEPVTFQMEYIGSELPFFKKLAFANPWLFKKPILEALNAHTSTAPTIIDGGMKNNVIPTVAEATINFRILPGESIESVEAHVKEIVGDKIKVERVGFLTNPSPVSSIEGEEYKVLEKTIRELFENTVVVPGLISGGTDARYFYDISDAVYRFYPIRINPTNYNSFHGINERLEVKNFDEMVGFTYQLIKNFND